MFESKTTKTKRDFIRDCVSFQITDVYINSREIRPSFDHRDEESLHDERYEEGMHNERNT